MRVSGSSGHCHLPRRPTSVSNINVLETITRSLETFIFLEQVCTHVFFILSYRKALRRIQDIDHLRDRLKVVCLRNYVGDTLVL